MELIEKVENLITEVQKTHKYSMSRIYGLYNEVFVTAETPQSCASCLIRKVNQLKSWLTEQKKIEITPTPQISKVKRKNKKSL